MRNRTQNAGHSLVELLVCVAIVGILMAMYLPALSKAKRKAEEVVIREGFRQEYIGRNADTANMVSRDSTQATRATCRERYRYSQDLGKSQIIVTELMYAVSTEAEFRAYWFTLIDPEATDELEYDSQGRLIAYDDDGNKFLLSPANWSGMTTQPVAWEFLSTDLSETSSGTLGTNVAYSDGHVQYVRYPGQFPACKSVAELSHRFMTGG